MQQAVIFVVTAHMVYKQGTKIQLNKFLQFLLTQSKDRELIIFCKERIILWQQKRNGPK